MYESMRLDDPLFAHTAAANKECPSLTSWITAVRMQKLKIGAPDWSPDDDAFLSGARKKASLKRFRTNELRQCLGEFCELDAVTKSRPFKTLPWAWLASSCGGLFDASDFDAWFLLRVTDRITLQPDHPCCCCGQPHPERGCDRLRAYFVGCGVNLEDALSYPRTPDSFTTALRIMKSVRIVFPQTQDNMLALLFRLNLLLLTLLP